METFFKKRPSTNDSNSGSSKKGRKAQVAPDGTPLLSSPTVIAAWNCNGLTSRLRGPDDVDIKSFVTTHKPDVIFLSEVRVCAANNSVSGKPGPHTKWFRSRMRDSDKKSLADFKLVSALLFSTELKDYKVYLSLANTKYAGTAMLVNKNRIHLPQSVRYNCDGKDVKGSVHDPEGRIIYAKFGEFSVLHTYSPNNGWEEGHFARRKAWDEKVRKFMADEKAAGVKLMWVGDLNIAPLDVDLSHPGHYRKQTGGRNGKKQANAPPLDSENIGQPGCTEAERNRFSEILNDGDLVDAYRELVGSTDSTGLSWRGHTTGIHAGRGMRIDHCMVSRALLPSIALVKITGHGVDRVGFLGSDHCPVIVTMKPSEGSDGDKTPEEIKLEGNGSGEEAPSTANG